MGFALQYSMEDATHWQSVLFTDEKCLSSVKQVRFLVDPHIEESSRILVVFPDMN